jgi:hypothetical protein
MRILNVGLVVLVGVAVIAFVWWAISGTTVKWSHELTRYEVLYLVLTALGATAVVLTFVVYWRMLRSMQQASSGQSILSLVDYLQRQDMQDARGLVIGELGNNPLDKWSPAQRRAASMVCSSYDVAGILARRGFVPLDLLTDSYAASILRCYSAGKPLITELRRLDNASARVNTRWSNFEWLYTQTATRYPDVPTAIGDGR